jgi:hypothetical protein
MTASGRSIRRRARSAAAACLRACRRHYASAASFTVIGVALFFALSSSSLSERTPQRRMPPTRTASLSSVQLPAGFRLTPVVSPPSRITYYLYDDEAEYALLQDVIRRDSISLQRQGLPNYIGEVYFLHVVGEVEEAAAWELLDGVAAMAVEKGLRFDVVDLRRD